MRASVSVLPGQTGSWLVFCDWFWGHPNRFCQRHCDRDRQQRIVALTITGAEVEAPPPGLAPASARDAAPAA